MVDRFLRRFNSPPRVFSHSNLINTQPFRIQRDFSSPLRRCQSSRARATAPTQLIHIDRVHSRAAIHSRVVQSPRPSTLSSIAENPQGKSGARRLERESHSRRFLNRF
ncbi:uncharacterized protein [Blastocystis hominis]|uniref:Uncharacterized protein n=1 Tax=Blastocystis hominis TaxID=12968 RepID=D8M5I8_BLAHO|nr:uncharacterized protein [Blastocystis hominis]CBK23327.2 unnamed protein product [Blastocystis hominis]|eukprot:XP_012897375.1 uncharacterized protein [Blastocystis hominis]